MKFNLLLIGLFISYNSVVYSQQTTAKAAFLEKWEHAKAYTLEVAIAMPDSVYAYKPTQRQMTFAEQLVHIHDNITWLGATYFNATVTANSTPKSKEEIMNALIQAFEQVKAAVKLTPNEDLKEVVDFFAGPKSKLQILNLLQDHLTHHRGQLIIYLNLNQVSPPRYVGW